MEEGIGALAAGVAAVKKELAGLDDAIAREQAAAGGLSSAMERSGARRGALEAAAARAEAEAARLEQEGEELRCVWASLSASAAAHGRAALERQVRGEGPHGLRTMSEAPSHQHGLGRGSEPGHARARRLRWRPHALRWRSGWRLLRLSVLRSAARTRQRGV